jgi:2'-5' RNA ligase
MHFRTYIAVAVTDEVRARAAKIVQRLKKCDAKVTWVAPENMHLTLKFLGDTPDTKIPEVCQRVANAAAVAAPFRMDFSELGAFPLSQMPRTVYLGISLGHESVTELQSRIEHELSAAGFSAERRRYVPHLTLGRVRGGGPLRQSLGDKIIASARQNAGTVPVSEVLTMASFRESDGPTYQVLGRAPLGG